MKSFAFLRHGWGVFIVLILSFWAVQPLLINGFFPIHDDTQVARVFEMGKALNDGMFPVRWVSDLGYGYGYPLFNFYAPLAYYAGGFFTLLGFDTLLATKIMMGLGILFSGIFMYFLAREFWGEIGGIISGLFYVYVPYHALDIYVRGAVGEFWAYAFVPLMTLGFYKVFQKRTWKWGVVGSIGYSGVILSHNLTALMFSPFLITLMVILSYFSYHRDKNILTTYYLLLTAALGLAIAAFYWMPALFEMRFTNIFSQIGGGANFNDHFICINQLWSSSWGFGGSAPGCILDGMSFQIGKLHVLVAFSTLLLFILPRLFKRIAHDNDTYYYSSNIIIPFSLTGFIVSVILTLDVSKTLWETIPLMAFLQYPWRFLLLVSFFSSLLAGSVIWFLEQEFEKSKYLNTVVYLSAGVLVFLLLFFNVKLFSPQTVVNKNAADYTNEVSLKWIVSKISDEYMPPDFKRPKKEEELPRQSIEVLKGRGTVKDVRIKTGRISAEVKTEEETTFKLNVAYFPAWKVFLDREITNFTIGNDGVYVEVSRGNHLIEAKFSQTLIEQLSNIASIIGVLLVFIGIISSNAARVHARKKTP